ncbi:MAG: (2Fe-2S) ferredoxin domain-containing protein [Bacteroidales bacterium]|nr:(2Fe-2S) ferredoxin domain-containing protein [Bacteroidales bacterium]
MSSTKPYEIVICLGSSCFSRGNKQTLRAISDYLKRYQLEDSVYFHGNHCFSDCDKGPVLKINDRIYEQVTPENVSSILDNFFNPNN